MYAIRSYYELTAQCNFGQRAVTVANDHQAKRGARNQRVTRLADASGNDDIDVGIGKRRIGIRQQTDTDATASRNATTGRLHHAVPSAANYWQALV